MSSALDPVPLCLFVVVRSPPSTTTHARESPSAQRPGPLPLAHVLGRLFQARPQSSIHAEGPAAPQSR